MPLIPLKDNVRTHPRAWVTFGLIAVLILVGVLPVPDVAQAAAGHGSGLHLGLNVLALWIFGPAVEQGVGRPRFLGLIVAASAAGYLGGIGLAEARDEIFLSTTAITAAVLGVYVACFPGARVVTLVPVPVIFSVVELPARAVAATWVLGTAALTASGLALWGSGEPTAAVVIAAVIAVIVVRLAPWLTVMPLSAPPRRP